MKRSSLSILAVLFFLSGQHACPPPCPDQDGDEYGCPASPQCLFPDLDCDDSDAGIHPCAEEICGNGIDENCSGIDYRCVIPDLDVENPEPNDEIFYEVDPWSGYNIVQGSLHTLALSPEGCFLGDFDNLLLPLPGCWYVRFYLEWCVEGADLALVLIDQDTQEYIGDGQYPGRDDFIEVQLPHGAGGRNLAVQITGTAGPPGTHFYLTIETNPILGTDGDYDGYDNRICGGDDCDDTDPSIHPCATEFAGDGVDSDCSGEDRPWHPPFMFDEIEPNDELADAHDLGIPEIGETVQGYGNICSTGLISDYTGDKDYFLFETPSGTAGLEFVFDALNDNDQFHIWLFKWNDPEWELVDKVAIAIDPKSLTVSADPNTLYHFFLAGMKGPPGEYELHVTATLK